MDLGGLAGANVTQIANQCTWSAFYACPACIVDDAAKRQQGRRLLVNKSAQGKSRGKHSHDFFKTKSYRTCIMSSHPHISSQKDFDNTLENTAEPNLELGHCCCASFMPSATQLQCGSLLVWTENPYVSQYVSSLSFHKILFKEVIQEYDILLEALACYQYTQALQQLMATLCCIVFHYEVCLKMVFAQTHQLP